MIPTERPTLISFWRWVTDPVTYLAWARLLLVEPLPFLSEDRRRHRHMVRQFQWWLSSERVRIWSERIACLAVLLLLTFMFYTWASFECALGRECTFASAHWANWLFSK